MMKKTIRAFVFIFVAFLWATGFVNPGLAAVTPSGTYQAAALADPVPAPFVWNAGAAYYNNHVIYTGDDGKIYGYDLDTADSTLICDTSALADPGVSSVAGFFVSSDHYLYFHDNTESHILYRLDLTDDWPVDYPAGVESFTANPCTGYIFAITENPWTRRIWFNSSVWGNANLYLYEVNETFTGATEKTPIGKRTGDTAAATGPIIFLDKDTLLFGEYQGGNGYFHLMTASTGTVITADYLDFTGGLASAVYGYDNAVFTATSDGATLFRTEKDTKTQIGATDDSASGLAFSPDGFYVAEMVPWSGGADDGEVSLHRLNDPAFTASITPAGPFNASVLPDPDPGAFVWSTSIAYYDNRMIYTGDDGKIYGFNQDTGLSTVICDTSPLAGAWSAVAGLLVSSDNHLYFHDNQYPTVNLYRIDLTAAWPVALPAAFNTVCNGSIYSLTENPWTGRIWFASADTAGANMYLYEVNAAFDAVVLKATLAKKDEANSGNGPIIFTGPSKMLYGESTFDGIAGYFHLVDTTSGTVLTQDYLTFDNGLASAAYGYDGHVYAVNGDGKTLYKIEKTQKKEAAVTANDLSGLCFDGNSLLTASMDDPGNVYFGRAWNPYSDAGFQALALAEPSPGRDAYAESMTHYYDNANDKEYLIYVGGSGSIYGYELSAGTTQEILPADAGTFPWGPSALTAASDGYLYFADNAVTENLYRIDLTAAWPLTSPGDVEVLDTDCDEAGSHVCSIFSLTENPWTGQIWFAASNGNDHPTGTLYLFSLALNFLSAIKEQELAKTDPSTVPQDVGVSTSSGNGPIIFEDSEYILYGESFSHYTADPYAFYGTYGYFHRINTTNGTTTRNYIGVAGGLAGAAYGLNASYATTGDEGKLVRIEGSTATEVIDLGARAAGLAFDGYNLYATAGTSDIYRVRPVPPPDATTKAITNLSASGATLSGTVNPGGDATQYYFRYGFTDKYGQTTAVTAAGNGTANVNVNAVLAALDKDTTYHYQLVAKNSAGIVYGDSRTFTTLAGGGGGGGGGEGSDDIADGDTVNEDGSNSEEVEDITVSTGVTLDNTGGTINGMVNRGTVTGGTLTGKIENHGTLEDVFIDENGVVTGGLLTGTISGSGTIKNATIDGQVSGVILGAGCVFTQNGLAANAGMDLTGILDNGSGQVDPALPIFENENGEPVTLADLVGNQLSASLGSSSLESTGSGNVQVSGDSLGVAVVCGQISQVSVTSEPDGIRITADGAVEIVSSGVLTRLTPSPADQAAFDAALAAMNTTCQTGGQGEMILDIPGLGQLVLRPSMFASSAGGFSSGDQLIAISVSGSTANRETYRLVATYGDGTVQDLLPVIHDMEGFREFMESLGIGFSIDVLTGAVSLFDPNGKTVWRGMPDYSLLDPPAGTDEFSVEIVGDLDQNGVIDFYIITPRAKQAIYGIH